MEVDRLVHEPARLSILSQLYVVEEADFLFVMQQVQLTQGNLSSHLAKLEEAGYVGVEKGFVGKRPRTVLRITPTGQRALERYVEGMKQLLDEVPVRKASRARRTKLVPARLSGTRGARPPASQRAR
jgi:DNA-binding MarR family transcriptional regulator